MIITRVRLIELCPYIISAELLISGYQLVHIGAYHEKTVGLTRRADGIDDPAAPRPVQILQVDERNAGAGLVVDIGEVRAVSDRSNVAGRDMPGLCHPITKERLGDRRSHVNLL